MRKRIVDARVDAESRVVDEVINWSMLRDVVDFLCKLPL